MDKMCPSSLDQNWFCSLHLKTLVLVPMFGTKSTIRTKTTVFKCRNKINLTKS